MKLRYRVLELPLEFTFTISRGSKTVAQTVLVELYDDPQYPDIVALGEAVPDRVYGEDIETVKGFYDALKTSPQLAQLDPMNIQAFEAWMATLPGHYAAKAGLSIALYDWVGKRLGAPLYEILGLDPHQAPVTSYTIGIAQFEEVAHKTQVALSRGYNTLKVKMGADLKLSMGCLQEIRRLAPMATIRVDANAAWTLEQAMTMMPMLAELGVEFVEEPLMMSETDERRLHLKNHSPLPIMADESCHRLGDIPRCGQLFHSINLKHPKTGGLWEALRMIHAARSMGLKIMLGCFAESSVSITAFAHLSPLVDYADLDGALLLANDPFDGVKFEGDRIRLPKGPGLGVTAKAGLLTL